MPLPPAPTKRAALLTSSAFDAPAKSTPKSRRKTPEKPAIAQKQPRPQRSQCCSRSRPASRTRSVVTRIGTSAAQPALRIVADKHDAEPAPAARAPADTGAAAPDRGRARKSTGQPKLFVLDTNVLLHDPMCLFRFEEHDIFLPMIVLEELDGHKKGMTEVARNARQTSRWLDALAGASGADIGARPAAGQHRPPRCRRQAVLPDRGAALHPAHQPAAVLVFTRQRPVQGGEAVRCKQVDRRPGRQLSGHRAHIAARDRDVEQRVRSQRLIGRAAIDGCAVAKAAKCPNMVMHHVAASSGLFSIPWGRGAGQTIPSAWLLSR